MRSNDVGLRCHFPASSARSTSRSITFDTDWRAQITVKQTLVFLDIPENGRPARQLCASRPARRWKISFAAHPTRLRPAAATRGREHIVVDWVPRSPVTPYALYDHQYTWSPSGSHAQPAFCSEFQCDMKTGTFVLEIVAPGAFETAVVFERPRWPRLTSERKLMKYALKQTRNRGQPGHDGRPGARRVENSRAANRHAVHLRRLPVQRYCPVAGSAQKRVARGPDAPSDRARARPDNPVLPCARYAHKNLRPDRLADLDWRARHTEGQYSRSQTAANVPTFSKDVAPILYKHCASCHRPGEIAPMSLSDLRTGAALGAGRSRRKSANATCRHGMQTRQPGPFTTSGSLPTQSDRQLLDWVNGGAPKGNLSDLPPAPSFTEGWSIGKPDVVLEMQEDYRIPANGTIEYEWLYIPTNFTEPKWVKSIEIRPGNREAVHHVLVYYRAKPDITRAPLARPNQKDQVTPRRRSPGERPQRADLKEIPQRLLATYAPGTNPQVAPDGAAFRLEPGGILELQMHYTTTGEATTDRTKVGLVFAKEPSPREVRATHFSQRHIHAAGRCRGYRRQHRSRIRSGCNCLGRISAHTSARKEMGLQVGAAERRRARPILAVPRYDFNWQTYYMFKEPLQVPKGAKIVSTAWYDNSAANKIQSRSEDRREVGRSDLGRDAVHRSLVERSAP